jgi:hypothetical protein
MVMPLLGEDRQYFATLPESKLGDALEDRINRFYQVVNETGLYYLWTRSYAAYYGSDLNERYGLNFDTASLGKKGDDGEIMTLKINHFKSFIKHTLQLTTAEKVALTCRSNNTDYKSQTQSMLGNGLLDYYWREEKVSRKVKRAAELALVMGRSWIYSPFDPEAGEDYRPDNGVIRKRGDTIFRICNPLDVIVDVDLRDIDDSDWWIVRVPTNKFYLAQKHKKFAKKIIESNIQSDAYSYLTSEAFLWNQYAAMNGNSDMTTLWCFYHKPCPLLPDGLIVEYCNGEILSYEPNDYTKQPVQTLAPETVQETIWGWTNAFELLAPQQALDILNSTMLTNNGNQGVSSVWTKLGDDIQVSMLSNGSQHFQSNTKPEAVNLVKTAPETIAQAKDIVADMGLISGINNVVRGQPEASLKSGNALALVVTQAVQYASMFEEAYINFNIEVGTSVLFNIKDFAKTSRVALITGIANRSFAKEYTAQDLEPIARIFVDPIPALSKTIGGRLEMARDLLQNGSIKSAHQYMTVLRTGLLDPATEATEQELLSVRAACESLREGKPVPALIIDNHKLRVNEYAALLSSPEARATPLIVDTVLDAIQAHIDLWYAAPPALLYLLGQEPPPPGLTAGQFVPPRQQPAAQNPQPVQPPAQPQLPSSEPLGPGLPSLPNLPDNAPPESQAAYESAIATQQGI